MKKIVFLQIYLISGPTLMIPRLDREFRIYADVGFLVLQPIDGRKN